MPRRKLNLQNLDELVAEVQRLLCSGYTMDGQWDLSQACNHLAYAMNKSIDGYPFKLPLPIRILVQLFGKRSFFRTRKIRPGLPAPSHMAPLRGDEAAAVAALIAAVERVKKHQGPWDNHPALGKLSPEQWREVHTIHSSHHLSFLIPRQN